MKKYRLKKEATHSLLPVSNKVMNKILDVSNLTRAELVPYYTYLIISQANDAEVKRMNDLILSKWKVSGLIYIKEKAWKVASSLGYTFENAWGGKTLPEVYNAIESLRRQQRAMEKSKQV